MKKQAKLGLALGAVAALVLVGGVAAASSSRKGRAAEDDDDDDDDAPAPLPSPSGVTPGPFAPVDVVPTPDLDGDDNDDNDDNDDDDAGVSIPTSPGWPQAPAPGGQPTISLPNIINTGGAQPPVAIPISLPADVVIPPEAIPVNLPTNVIPLPTLPSVVTAPPSVVLPPSVSVPSVPSLDVVGKQLTDAMVRELKTAERNRGWKREYESVAAWQAHHGRKVDKKFGPKDALFLATLTGEVPVVRYWPAADGTNPKRALQDYKGALSTIAATKGNPHRDLLLASIARERGQSFGPPTGNGGQAPIL